MLIFRLLNRKHLEFPENFPLFSQLLNSNYNSTSNNLFMVSEPKWQAQAMEAQIQLQSLQINQCKQHSVSSLQSHSIDQITCCGKIKF